MAREWNAGDGGQARAAVCAEYVTLTDDGQTFARFRLTDYLEPRCVGRWGAVLLLGPEAATEVLAEARTRHAAGEGLPRPDLKT